jgi:hypothetical protein
MSTSERTAPKASKSVWESILTATPVVLTVLATILAGLSNSEMTQAQYHRSLAAQYQSKAGDQWAFFQAKKIRSTQLESTAEQLHATGRCDAGHIKALAHQLTVAMERAADDATKAEEAAGLVKSVAGSDPDENPVKKAKELEQQLVKELDASEAAKAFTYVSKWKLPEVSDHTFADDEAIKNTLIALKSGESDADINKLALKVKDEPLRNALTVAQQNAKQFDDASSPIDKTLEQINKAAGELAALAENGITAPTLNPSDSTKGLKERETATAAEEHSRRVAERLHKTMAAARDRYNANRLRQDGFYNQQIAWLHEIQVHKSDADAARHRERSMHFFIGMLGAQAGVAISSMALAKRRRSILWALAGVLGLAAVVFSAYVYMYR